MNSSQLVSLSITLITLALILAKLIFAEYKRRTHGPFSLSKHRFTFTILLLTIITQILSICFQTNLIPIQSLWTTIFWISWLVGLLKVMYVFQKVHNIQGDEFNGYIIFLTRVIAGVAVFAIIVIQLVLGSGGGYNRFIALLSGVTGGIIFIVKLFSIFQTLVSVVLFSAFQDGKHPSTLSVIMSQTPAQHSARTRLRMKLWLMFTLSTILEITFIVLNSVGTYQTNTTINILSANIGTCHILVCVYLLDYMQASLRESRKQKIGGSIGLERKDPTKEKSDINQNESIRKVTPKSKNNTNSTPRKNDDGELLAELEQFSSIGGSSQ